MVRRGGEGRPTWIEANKALPRGTAHRDRTGSNWKGASKDRFR